MVKDFYNSSLNESSADDRPEMSQEELRFLRELESTVVLKDGHYEIALPLKDRDAPVPNDKKSVVTVNNNSPIQDYVHPEDQTQPTFEMTPWFKPFTIESKLNSALTG